MECLVWKDPMFQHCEACAMGAGLIQDTKVHIWNMEVFSHGCEFCGMYCGTLCGGVGPKTLGPCLFSSRVDGL